MARTARPAAEMTISAARAKTAPKYEKTAAELLARCREFYADPEAEAEYQEWKKTRTEGRKDEQKVV